MATEKPFDIGSKEAHYLMAKAVAAAVRRNKQLGLSDVEPPSDEEIREAIESRRLTKSVPIA